MEALLTDSGTLDVSTRADRRQVVALIIMLLCRVSHAEESCLKRIPVNLQSGSGYDAGEKSIDMIAEAIFCLIDAY